MGLSPLFCLALILRPLCSLARFAGDRLVRYISLSRPLTRMARGWEFYRSCLRGFVGCCVPFSCFVFRSHLAAISPLARTRCLAHRRSGAADIALRYRQPTEPERMVGGITETCSLVASVGRLRSSGYVAFGRHCSLGRCTPTFCPTLVAAQRWEMAPMPSGCSCCFCRCGDCTAEGRNSCCTVQVGLDGLRDCAGPGRRGIVGVDCFAGPSVVAGYAA